MSLQKLSRAAELIGLFLAFPLLMALGYLPRNPIIFLNVFGGIAYFLLRQADRFPFRGISPKEWEFLKVYFVCVPLFSIFSYFYLGEHFLSMPRQRPLLWLLICLLYPFLSVLAQEALYRVWFFDRYAILFPTPVAMIAASSILFGFGHIVMRNPEALILSTAGGVLFSVTYHRTRSFRSVWLEHSLWGLPLFTLGWGFFLYHGAH